MGYSRLETGYNPYNTTVINLPDGTLVNLASRDGIKQIDAMIEIADEYVGYDFGNQLRDFVADLGNNPYEGAYETDDTDDAKKEYNKISFQLRLLIQEYQAMLSHQRTFEYSEYLKFTDQFDGVMDQLDELDIEADSGFGDEDFEELRMSDDDFNNYYRQIRDFVDVARDAVNDEYAVALENVLAGVVEDGEYIRNDEEFLQQLNPLLKYQDAFDEMQNIVERFTKAVSRKQKVTVKAFKELLMNLQKELNELPRN